MKPRGLLLAVIAVLASWGLAQPEGPPTGLPPSNDAEVAEARAALAGIQAIDSGASLTILSVDMRVIHAAGRVQPGGVVRLGRLPAGAQVRVLVGLPADGDQVRPRVFDALVDATGRVVLILTPTGAVDLARALRAFGVTLEVERPTR